MHVSKILLSISIPAVLTSCYTPEKAIEAIRKLPVETIRYSESETHARGIAGEHERIYLASADGQVYELDTKTKVHRMLPIPKLPELRDVSVSPDGATLVAMQSAGSSSTVFLTHDTVIAAAAPGKPVFLDGMDILESGTGFLMGDPVDGHFSLFRTEDEGKSWQVLPNAPAAMPGEAGYAASGTNVQCITEDIFVFVSGGLKNRFFRSEDSGNTWRSVDLPYAAKDGTGPFSVCFKNEHEGVIVGGDYTLPAESKGTSYYTEDGGLTWTASEIPTLGYRSCAVYDKGIYYACGSTGVDFSLDQGKTWHKWLENNAFAMKILGNTLYITTVHSSVLQIKL
jgi:photosystem II stability/assembly factor-like uncharacterized protein